MTLNGSSNSFTSLLCLVSLFLGAAAVLSADLAFGDEQSGGIIRVGNAMFATDVDQEYTIAKTIPSTVRVRRDTDFEATDCMKIAERLRQSEQNIARCSSTTRPTAICEMLGDTLRREILGIRNDAMGTVEPDVLQLWVIDTNLLGGSQAAVNESQIALQLGMSATQVKIARTAEAKFDGADLQVLPGSMTNRLLSAGFNWSKPTGRIVKIDAMTAMETKNRLVTCELASGLIKISSRITLAHSWQVPADVDALHSEWNVYKGLQQALSRPGLTTRKQFVYSGYMLNELANKFNLNLEEEASFWAVAKRLIVLDGALTPNDQFGLRPFPDRFGLGREVPQAEHTGSMRIDIESTPEL